MGISLSVAKDYPKVIDALKLIPEVVECHFITGNHALLLKLYCMDNDHLMNVLINTIQNIDGVERTETWLSLEEAIERQVWVNDSDYNKDSNRQKKEVKKKSAK